MFDNYMTAFSEEDIAEKSFAYSLLGYGGTGDFVYTHSGCWWIWDGADCFTSIIFTESERGLWKKYILPAHSETLWT